MFNKIKEFFFGKPQAAAPEAPYKIETPVYKPTADAAPVVPDVAATASTKPARKPRANVAAKKIAAAKKPAAKKTTAKKPVAPTAQ